MRLIVKCSLIWIARLLLITNSAVGQGNGAPADRPVALDSATIACLDSALLPLIAQARSSFPQFRRRLEAGLPEGNYPAVTIRLHDATGRHEQTFLAVDSIRRDTIFGRINTDIALVSGYKTGQYLSVPVSEVLDWTISRPDGTEEGNLIGKFMDALQDRLQRAPQRKPC